MDCKDGIKLNDGTRRRSGCLGCRRQKRRCDEQKPVCSRCAKAGAFCAYLGPRSPSAFKFIISTCSPKAVLPIILHEDVDFINLSSNDLPKLCAKYKLAAAERPSLTEMCTFSSRTSRQTNSAQLAGILNDESETRLIQYYFEVISTSRVYVSTKRNAFRSAIMPILFHNRGPLLFAVVALSALETSHLCPFDSTDFYSIAQRYKSQALLELQDGLGDPSVAEENLLTTVLLSSLEIAGGSQPTWLLHLRGALAIIRQFLNSISPEVAYFALQYFRFRYITMRTTELTESETKANLSSDEVDLLGAATLLAASGKGHQGPDAENVIDENFGCSFEMVGLIFQMAEMGTNERQEKRHPHWQAVSSSDLQRLDENLRVISFSCPEGNGYYLHRSAQCFKVAARLYLQLACYHVDINEPVILHLEEELLAALSRVITDGQPRRSFPLWPLFIAGCASYYDMHRKIVLRFFKSLQKKWPLSNIATVLQVIWTIWQSRDLGMRHPQNHSLDWQDIIKKFGWKLALS